MLVCVSQSAVIVVWREKSCASGSVFRCHGIVSDLSVLLFDLVVILEVVPRSRVRPQNPGRGLAARRANKRGYCWGRFHSHEISGRLCWSKSNCTRQNLVTSVLPAQNKQASYDSLMIHIISRSFECIIWARNKRILPGTAEWMLLKEAQLYFSSRVVFRPLPVASSPGSLEGCTPVTALATGVMGLPSRNTYIPTLSIYNIGRRIKSPPARRVLGILMCMCALAVA